MPSLPLHVLLSPVSVSGAGPEHTCLHRPGGVQASTDTSTGVSATGRGLRRWQHSAHLDLRGQRWSYQGWELQGQAQLEEVLEGSALGPPGPCGQRRPLQGGTWAAGTHLASRGFGVGGAQGCNPHSPQRLWQMWGSGPGCMQLEGVPGQRLRPGTRVARRGLGGRSSGPRPTWLAGATGCGGSGTGPQQACRGLRNLGRCWPHSPPIPQSPEGSSLSPLIHLPWVGPSEHGNLHPLPVPPQGCQSCLASTFLPPLLPSHILPGHVGIPPIPLGVQGHPPAPSKCPSCEEMWTPCPPTLSSYSTPVSIFWIQTLYWTSALQIFFLSLWLVFSFSWKYLL